MAHPLDRPVWSALTGPQAHLAQGNARAWRIDPEIGLFAAAATPSDRESIAALLPDDAPLILFEDEPWSSFHADIVVAADPMVQMIAEAIDPPSTNASILPLDDDDAAEMLALATLTRPGPFLARTHHLGGFAGIREGGVLAAMAGTRLRMPGYVEISGVCTHPDYRAKGYGSQLIRAVAQSILTRGDRPCLHAFQTNVEAIALYQRLGFHIRRVLTVSFLTRTAA